MQGSKKVRRCLLAALGAVIVGCGESSERDSFGSVHVVAVFPPGTNVQKVSPVTMAVAGPGMSPVYGGLTLTDGNWSGTRENVPEGIGRIVTVQVFTNDGDMFDGYMFDGDVQEVSIQGGETTSLTVTLKKYCLLYEGAECPEHP